VKQNWQMILTDEGMQIDECEEESRTTDSAIAEAREPPSDGIAERWPHPNIDFSPRTSTDNGMTIGESDEHSQNANLSIRKSLEPDSNVTAERLEQ
jgi:hypothetical protein